MDTPLQTGNELLDYTVQGPSSSVHNPAEAEIDRGEDVTVETSTRTYAVLFGLFVSERRLLSFRMTSLRQHPEISGSS